MSSSMLILQRRVRSVKTFIRDGKWVFETFGWKAALVYLWDSLLRGIRRLSPEKEDKRTFVQLTDEEAQWTAWAFGIHTWTDRADLNRQWEELEASFQRMN